MIANRYNEILNFVEPYLLGNPKVFDNYSLNVFGKEFNSDSLMSCLSTKNYEFFKLVHKLDSLTFGHQGMGMDKWVFFDCSAMPAGIFGFAIPRKLVPDKLLRIFEVPDDYQGLVPITMYMAIPTSDRGRWFGHNLSSLSKFLDQDVRGIGLLTKAFACQVFQIEWCYGATQWGSPALEIHTQLSDMKLKASYLPAHTHQNSLCYVSDYSLENLERALNGERRVSEDYDFLIESADLVAQKDLQEKIEAGSEFSICARPIHQDEKIFYPIKKLN